MRWLAVALGAAFAWSLAAGPAAAQANRTFVSGHGLDTNPCSLAAPCRTFQHAHDQTSAGGEITVLDPAGYGSVAITKAISIVNDGVGEAGVTVGSNADAIDINIGSGDVVNLRGLTLVGSGKGAYGINFGSPGSVNIQNCVIRGFGYAIAASSSTRTITNVSDVVLSDNDVGISIAGFSALAFIKRVQSTRGAFIAESGATVTISNSAVNGSGVGLIVYQSTAIVADSQLFANTIGIDIRQVICLCDPYFSYVYLAHSTVSGNSTAFVIAPGVGEILSYGNNHVVGNASVGATTSSVGPR